MEFWFMRMRQGQGGQDYAKELWAGGRVGVLWGTWRIQHVLDAKGQIDPNKLTFEGIQSQCPQPDWFTEDCLAVPRTFLCEVAQDDRVVVTFDNALHVGTIGTGFLDDSMPRSDEYFKCRPVVNQKSYRFRSVSLSWSFLPPLLSTSGWFGAANRRSRPATALLPRSPDVSAHRLT